MNFSLIAAVLSLLVLLSEMAFSQWNKRSYRQKIATGATSNEVRTQFKAAMQRKEWARTTSLFLLIAAALLGIHSDRQEPPMNEDDVRKLNEQIAAMTTDAQGADQRLARIETYLWGGEGGLPVAPRNPTPSGGGPSDHYMTIDERLVQMQEQLSDLQKRAATKEELQEVYEELMRLKAQVKEYRQLMEQGGLAAPAG